MIPVGESPISGHPLPFRGGLACSSLWVCDLEGLRGGRTCCRSKISLATFGCRIRSCKGLHVVFGFWVFGISAPISQPPWGSATACARVSPPSPRQRLQPPPGGRRFNSRPRWQTVGRERGPKSTPTARNKGPQQKGHHRDCQQAGASADRRSVPGYRSVRVKRVGGPGG